MGKLINKTLLTGVTGFIGKHLAGRLLSDGVEVHAVVRPGSHLLELDSLADKIILHEHDGSTENLISIVEESRPEAVFHLASLFLAQHSPPDIAPMIRSNVTFGTQLLEAMTANSVNYMINTGTNWQHFENRDFSPVCLYAATKKAFEDIITFYSETTPLRTVTLKLFDVYGPGDTRRKVTNLLWEAAETGKELAMSPGEQLIDLVYIDDIIDAFLQAGELALKLKESTSKSYMVSSGSPLSLREMARIFSEVTGLTLPIKWGGRPYRKREVMVPATLGTPLPGWQPSVSLPEGIARTFIREEDRN